MSEKTFLVEIGTEELPPKHYAAWLSPLLRTLLRSWITLASHGTVQWFAAPRRLALKVANLAEAQPDREIENVVRQLLRRSTLKANRVKRQKVGRVVAVLPLTRLSV